MSIPISDAVIGIIGAGGLSLGSWVTYNIHRLGVRTAVIDVKLTDHINDETNDLKGVMTRLENVERKLPNGELQEVLKQLKMVSAALKRRKS